MTLLARLDRPGGTRVQCGSCRAPLARIAHHVSVSIGGAAARAILLDNAWRPDGDDRRGVWRLTKHQARNGDGSLAGQRSRRLPKPYAGGDVHEDKVVAFLPARIQCAKCGAIQTLDAAELNADAFRSAMLDVVPGTRAPTIAARRTPSG